MKTKLLSVASALALAAVSANAQTAYTLWATNVTDNVPSYTTGDSLLALATVTPSTGTNRYLARGGDFLGIKGGVNGGAIDSGAIGTSDEQLTLSLAPNAELSGFASKWTRADIYISGFLSDPQLTGTRGTISYDSGTVLIDNYAWNGGNVDTFTFGNPDASLGQTLTLWVSDNVQANPQFTLARIDYTLVPEPATWTLGLLGVVALAVRRRAAR
jgi:hypothetical protein